MENRFLWQIKLLPIFFIIFTAGILFLLNFFELKQEKEKQIAEVTSNFIEQQKKMAQNRVMTASELIRFQYSRTEELVRKRVNGRVDEAINIANAFYERYHATVPKKELEEQIKLMLSNALFDHPDGYFFAVDMNTEKIIVHKLDNLVGYSMSQHKDLRGTLVLTEQKKLLSHSDGAFQKIYFSKPAEPDKEFPKQLYIRYFKPFNWLIGTGEYIDDMEKRLQEDVLKRLETIYTGDNNYLFIIKMYNWEGGDGIPYTSLILSNDPIHRLGQPFFDTDQDSMDKYYRKEVLNFLQDHGEGFVNSSHFFPKQGQEIKKTSFFFYDKTWNWTIGSGFYYDVLEKQLAKIEKNINERITKEIWSSIGITLLIIIIMSTIFFVISQRIARMINTYAQKLEQAQKMESVGRLAGGVAHDFNNMLGVILGHVEFAMEEIEEDHNLYSDLKEIQTAAKRSAALTRQLLTFARKQVISPRQLDLNDTIENMLNMLRRLIGEDIDLVWKPSDHLWPVKMDPTQIDQVLANLCVNARDAIDGVGKLTIETGKKSFDETYCKKNPGFIPGDFVLLAVSDNGCGMDKDTLGNLFDPFFTTKEMGKGTGLGLATVYGIVKQNNGFINVYTEPGQGSTFKIYLPRASADEDPDKAVLQKKAAAGGTETILLVEDEPTILKMTSMMLERKGYTVLSAGTPTEALEKAKNHSGAIDFLMTDVVMPELNGRDLAEQITALYPGIRILFMSGYTANVIAHHGVLDKGVAFIQKPFSMVDLTEKVREVLDMPG